MSRQQQPGIRVTRRLTKLELLIARSTEKIIAERMYRDALQRELRRLKALARSQSLRAS